MWTPEREQEARAEIAEVRQNERYTSFHELAKERIPGREFSTAIRHRNTDIAIIAPHGGSIEPGTERIARVLAGEALSLYLFESHLPKEAALDLRITSSRFDDPQAIAIANSAERVVTVHGCLSVSGYEGLFLGGRDKSLIDEVRQALKPLPLFQRDFLIADDTLHPGKARSNICNRGRTNKGLQLEFSEGLREAISDDLSAPHPEQKDTGKMLIALRRLLHSLS